MEYSIVLLICFIFIFLPLSLCNKLSKSKNRDSLNWIFAGLVFGWLAVIVLFFLPTLSKADRTTDELKRRVEIAELESRLKELQKS